MNGSVWLDNNAYIDEVEEVNPYVVKITFRSWAEYDNDHCDVFELNIGKDLLKKLQEVDIEDG